MSDSKGFSMLSTKHDGSNLQAMPMLFTYTPVEKQAQSAGTGTGGFQQAGGHEGVFKNSGPILEKTVGQREREFYEQAQAGKWPKGFLPAYHGDKGGGQIGIENLMHGMRCPCVIDLKMGTATVEAADQNFVKKIRMGTLDLVTGSTSHGVRLEGMSVYRALESGKIKTSKAQSHAISAAANVNLQDVLMFFLTDESGIRRDIAQSHLERHLYHFEHNNSQFLFIGSSILLIYDNDNAAPHSRWARALERATRLHPDVYAALRRKTRVDVRMIDFAHTGPLPAGARRDEGYITGLKSIIGALRLVRRSGVGPMRPIFSLAAAATEARDSASRKPQHGLPALHESAPLLYPPQPEPPSAPHYNATFHSNSFSHPSHPSALSAPLAHASSQPSASAPGYYTPPAPPPGPPIIATPPPGAYGPYTPPPGIAPAPLTGGLHSTAAPPTYHYTPQNGSMPTLPHTHHLHALHKQPSAAHSGHASGEQYHWKPEHSAAPSEPLDCSFGKMKLGSGHAGAGLGPGPGPGPGPPAHQTAPPPAAGLYGPTFSTLFGLPQDHYRGLSAPGGTPSGGGGLPGAPGPPNGGAPPLI